MPWTSKDAYRHTHKAKSPKAQRQWEHVSNSALKRGASEASAIRQANAVVARRKHAAGGAISPLAALVGNPMAMRSTVPHLGRSVTGMGGRMRMPHVPLADTLHNINQHMSGARAKLPKIRAKTGGSTTCRYDEGGAVTPARRSSSPGSPGVGGAVQDALAALRDYFINRPAREIQAAREARENAVVEGNAPGNFAGGGEVVALGERAVSAIKDALSHLANRDVSSAAATLRASPEAMRHPVVQQAAQALRSSAGVAPATRNLTGVVNADTDRRIMPTMGSQ